MTPEQRLAHQALLLYDALNDRSIGEAMHGNAEQSNRLNTLAEKALQRYERRYSNLTTTTK